VRRVLRQHELVAQLERNGHDTADAKGLPHEFEELPAVFIQDRDRMCNELGQLWRRAQNE
jgi:hypothetical protein